MAKLAEIAENAERAEGIERKRAKLCPLLDRECEREGCAWWTTPCDRVGGCAVTHGEISARDVAGQFVRTPSYLR